MKKWNYKLCKEEALKYETKSEFSLKSGGASNCARKNNWYDDITKHMISNRKPNGYWSYNKCKEEALKYKTKNEFRYQSNSAYQIAKRNKFLDKICSHMIPLGNRNYKTIYSYEFSDNHVYVGLTYDINKRNWEHLNDIKSPVFKHKMETNINPIKKILTIKPVNINKAKILENYWVDYYQHNNWILLNKAKPGALGGNKIYWTYEKCYDEALKYNTKYQFQKKSGGAYNSALKNNWLLSITKHMIKTQKPTGYWDVNSMKISELQLKYNKKYMFIYKIIKRLRWEWLDDSSFSN